MRTTCNNILFPGKSTTLPATVRTVTKLRGMFEGVVGDITDPATQEGSLFNLVHPDPTTPLLGTVRSTITHVKSIVLVSIHR